MRAKTKGKHEIRKRSAIVVATVLAMIVSVVGWATAGTVGAQTPSCLPTSDRTFGPHALAGTGIKARAPVYTDALQFAAGGGRLDSPWVVHRADALTSEGFVSGTSQHYFGKLTRFVKRVERSGPFWSGYRQAGFDNGGDAQTVQLGSPEQAQAELNRDLAEIIRKPGGQDAPWKRFTVAAIPGSQGVRSGKSTTTGYCDRGCVVSYLGFTDGDYSYVIRRLSGQSGGVLKHRRALRGTKQVTNAAINLYNRVHGAAVCP